MSSGSPVSNSAADSRPAAARGPLTAAGIYQIVARRGRQCGVEVYPHRFRHHFSHTWLYCTGAGRKAT